MQIRFLQTVASENPAFPFQPGQVITVTSPGPFLQRVLDSGAAEIVRVDETERAVEPDVEQPEPVRKARRRAVH